ncbi:MAG: FHA domain-containing protein [Anaerolineales bacterium]|nr:FHA domain-containing protein [Anaerolineales bacterium]
MPVEFYVHAPMPDNSNERRAACRVARLLYQQYRDSEDHLLLVVNVDPAQAAVAPPAHDLTQLDALLLGPNFVAILDFKNYFDPIESPSAHGAWYAVTRHGAKKVLGGASENPLQQAYRARAAWSAYFQQVSAQFLAPERQQALHKAWPHLSFFLLFHPYLNARSRLPALGNADHWFHPRSIDQVTELAYALRSPLLRLTPAECRGLVLHGLRAQPWDDMAQLLPQQVLGYLMVSEPDSRRAPVRYPLSPFDAMTIGRSASVQGHRVSSAGLSLQVSGRHAQVETTHQDVLLQDLGSKNGTYVNGQCLEAGQLVVLQPGQRAFLGNTDSQACHIWFEPRAWYGDSGNITLVTQTGSS